MEDVALKSFGLLTSAILATVQMLKLSIPEKLYGVGTIFVAIVLGALAGWQQVAGVPDMATGILAGLAATAVMTVADKFGTKKLDAAQMAILVKMITDQMEKQAREEAEAAKVPVAGQIS